MISTSQSITISSKEDSNPIKLDFLHVKKASLILRALNHKLRQQIIKLLDESERLTVTEIYVKLRLEQSVASQHLAILRRTGIVMTQRDGKFIYYAVNYNRVAEVNQFVENLVSK
ncbi:MAG: helix-turn-helix transcriptional regulator [Pedobacter sp.]|nr:helix-turn-helix transcriptional regulator [Pedobacter sp.]